MSPRTALWRIRDRAAFQALRGGRPGRCGAVSVTWLAPTPAAVPTPPRVAYAVGRAAGGAVVRNRIRRRLRGAVTALHRAGEVPAGTYLVAARNEAADQGFQSLVSDLRTAIGAATTGDRP